MSLSPRAIATLGIGLGARQTAYFGLWPVGVPPAAGTVSVRLNGAWREVTVRVRENGVWRESEAYLREGGEWL